ncbi:dipeptidase [Kroppenstedtia eburnea]|uniref:dipeptidase n=1 Tax=Kroppenstedtia eburnea TaxID=714067 RepID=UPI003631ECEE
MMEQVNLYFSGKRAKLLEELKDFIRIPSVSTSPDFRKEMFRCAQHVAGLLHQAGLEHVKEFSAGGYPIVYGDWLHAPGCPTVLVYGHYDVQPAEPLELWQSPPFQPEIRDEKLFGRGASDNKGQIFLHIKTIEALLELTGRLPFNIKFCIEGEEEIGSPGLSPFLQANQDLLQADLAVISDTAMLGENQPAVCYALRGLLGVQIDVRGPATDLPSGSIYGGAVQNPIHALVHLLSSMRNDNGRIAVKGFYDEVLPVPEQEREALAGLPFRDSDLVKRLNVPELFGEEGYTTLERAWIRPTLEINGIHGGGEGGQTIIPSTAHAHVTCRLVPDQNPQVIFNRLAKHIQEHTPPGVEVTVTAEDPGHKPYMTPINHPAIRLAAEAYENAYGVPCHWIRAGGSILVVETLADLFDIPVVLMGFGLPDGNVHGPNEYFSLQNFDKGFRTLCFYWLRLKDCL